MDAEPSPQQFPQIAVKQLKSLEDDVQTTESTLSDYIRDINVIGLFFFSLPGLWKQGLGDATLQIQTTGHQNKGGRLSADDSSSVTYWVSVFVMLCLRVL